MANLTTGEKIAGISGLALILIMFIFNWFSIDTGGLGDGGANAWDSMELIRFIILLAALAGIGLAVAAATQSDVNLPVAASAITAGLGILAVVLIAYRIIDPPEPDLGGLGIDLEINRSIGVFLGLIAAGGVAFGGWRAMEEEGTSFSGQAGGYQDPPPPAAPPAA